MNSFGLDILDLGISMTEDPIASFNPSEHPFYAPEPLEAILQTRTPLTPWPAKLPLELALGGSPIEEIFERCGVVESDYIQWATMPAFRKALSEAASQVRDQGASFKVLCHGIAMDFLPTLDEKLHDPCVALTTKIDVLKKIVQWAGLEPKEEKVQQGNANQVMIQINL